MVNGNMKDNRRQDQQRHTEEDEMSYLKMKLNKMQKMII